MDGFIQSQRGDGQLDSSGEFALDPVAAARKLRQHTGRHRWMTRWIQSSVVAGASWVKLRSSSTDCIMSNDALPLAEDELRSLTDPTVALGSPERRLQHYSVCFLAGLGPRPTKLQVGCWRDGFEHVLTVEGEEVTIESIDKPRPVDGNNWIQMWFRLSRPQWLVLAALRPLARMAKHPLTPLVRFCPIPVLVEGRLLNQPLCADLAVQAQGKALLNPGSELDGGLYFLGDTSQTGAVPGFPVAHGRSLAWVRGDPHSPETWQTVHRTGRSLRDLLTKPPLDQQVAVRPEEELEHLWCGQRKMLGCVACLQLAPKKDSVLWLVVDGVSLNPLNLNSKGFRVVVAASHLKTDLSGDQAVDNDDFRATLRFVDALIKRYLSERG
ncbi:MAG: hypothetical protein KC910_24725 [Candidatus Eremiobacteraeota bacterium]|nr:hypothetical protein [Candidatus Eremiobacteraeota bacterium]